jgi:hypothetical protein
VIVVGRWENSAAWAVCAVNADACEVIAATANKLIGGDVGCVLVEAAFNYSKVVSQASSARDVESTDMYYAHQFCFAVTLGQALPFFFVVWIGFLLFLGMLRLPFVVISAGTQLLVQILAFTHAE